MSLPFAYIVRNIAARRLTTALTAGGMALVVYVFATVLMLAAGLEQTLVTTGQSDNVVVIRRAAQTEVQSGVDRMQAGIVESLSDIAVGRDGQKLVSKEVVVLINLPKRTVEQAVERRHPRGHARRSRVATSGEARRWADVPAGNGRGHRRSLDRQPFPGRGLGETLRFASADWTVVGIYDAGRTGFDSEIWGDAEQMMQAFRRLAFSALVFKLGDTGRFDAVKQEIETDPRLTLEAKRETRFYADQSELLSKFISYLGTTISVIFSIGAVIGAMITMYASVASRTAEIGTLRALGFSRTAILTAFLVEALLLGAIGGIVGLVAASFMQALAISTTNFQTFAELAFTFTLTPGIIVASLSFALAMGFVGGFLPAARAARMKIVDALRAV